MIVKQQILPSTFNRRITIKTANVVMDNGRSGNNGYINRFTTWASIENISSQRAIKMGLDAFVNAYQVTTRYTKDRIITTNDLFDYVDGVATKTMQVKGVTLINEGYKMYQQLIVSEFNPTS